MVYLRILYEDDEIGVTHPVVQFKSDGDVQSVMSFLRFKDDSYSYTKPARSTFLKNRRCFQPISH